MNYLILTVAMMWFPQPIETDWCSLSVIECQKESPEYLIEQYADDVPTAKRIATCESQMGKYRKNWSGSSATGLFQFMPKTFNAYCSGDIKSDRDQILCFNKLYKLHPSWWECQ
jgi:hypothetical protein